MPKYSTDSNHKEIIDYLRSFGFQVLDCAKFGTGWPDLFVCRNNRVCLIEVKAEKGAEIKKTQMRFIGSYRGYVGFAENTDQALKLAQEPDLYALKQIQKDKIAAFEQRFDKPKMNWPSFKKLVLGYE